jgi:hypothetical protein
VPDAAWSDNLRTRAEVLRGDLITTIEHDHAHMQAVHSVSAYIDAWDHAPPYSRYRSIPPKARETCSSIEQRWGRDGIELYHRLVIAQLVAGFSDRAAFQTLPARVRECCARTLQRILGIAEKGRPGYFDHTNDLFAKDLAVCRGKLIPCGAELVDWQAGIPRRLLLKRGLRQFIRGAGYLGTKMHGFKPLYESHWDRRLIADFNAEGYRRFYLNVAELLHANPGVKGYMACGWWFDPALATISPELDFIGKIPLAHGAILLAAGAEGSTVQDALWLSRRRTELYKAGQYRPTGYVMLWSRADFLAWHQTTP